MERDKKRYNSIKILIEAGHIETFNQIYHYLPKSSIAKELNMNTDRITQLIEHPEKFTLDKLMKIATVLNVDSKKIFDIIHQQLLLNKKKPKTK